MFPTHFGFFPTRFHNQYGGMDCSSHTSLSGNSSCSESNHKRGDFNTKKVRYCKLALLNCLYMSYL